MANICDILPDHIVCYLHDNNTLVLKPTSKTNCQHLDEEWTIYIYCDGKIEVLIGKSELPLNPYRIYSQMECLSMNKIHTLYKRFPLCISLLAPTATAKTTRCRKCSDLLGCRERQAHSKQMDTEGAFRTNTANIPTSHHMTMMTKDAPKVTKR